MPSDPVADGPSRPYHDGPAARCGVTRCEAHALLLARQCQGLEASVDIQVEEARARAGTGEAIRALAGLQAKTARVLRDGAEQDILVEAVVPETVMPTGLEVVSAAPLSVALAVSE